MLNVIILDKNQIKKREGEAEAGVRGWGRSKGQRWSC